MGPDAVRRMRHRVSCVAGASSGVGSGVAAARSSGPAEPAANPYRGRTAAPDGTSALGGADDPSHDRLEEVARDVAACRRCGLCQGRTRTVPGEGVARPLVMVIGEAPGRDEDRSGRPFVGAAGAYLDRWLAAIGLRRTENCFITNVVKCRPPDNRDPQRDESQACLPYLQRQMRLLAPRALLTVGRIAGQLLTGREVSMAALRGQVYDYPMPGSERPVPLVATYHPSGVLRNQSWRRPVWDDLRRLQGLLAGTGGDAGAAGAGDATPPTAAR